MQQHLTTATLPKPVMNLTAGLSIFRPREKNGSRFSHLRSGLHRNGPLHRSQNLADRITGLPGLARGRQAYRFLHRLFISPLGFDASVDVTNGT